MAIKHDNGADPVKGKSYINMDDGVQPVRQVPRQLGWIKPCQGWTKLNTDGAFGSNEDASGDDIEGCYRENYLLSLQSFVFMQGCVGG